MVQLTEKAVKEFQDLAKAKRGIDLSLEEAQAGALEWLEFFKLIYEPITEVKK